MKKKNKTGMWQRLKNVVEKAKALDLDSLKYIRFGLFGFIVVDIFGIHWYLGLKTLGNGLLIFGMICLAIVLFLENQQSGLDFNTIRKTSQTYLEEKLNKPKKQKGGKKKMEQTTAQVQEQKQDTADKEPKKPAETTEEAPKDEDEKEEPIADEGYSVPSPEEYQKRMENAFGSV